MFGVITGSRADWNGLGMVARELEFVGERVKVFAIGQHADSEDNLKAVIEDGFDPILLATNVGEHMAHGSAGAAAAIAKALERDPVKMVIVLGDRFEILGAIQSAVLLGIPVAHIGGGDITDGSIDNKLRYAMTALADMHFTTTGEAGKRVHDRVLRNEFTDHHIHVVGNPALDRIPARKIVSRETLFKEIGLEPQHWNVLVAYHAATANKNPWVECEMLFSILDELPDTAFMLLGTNADHGSKYIGQIFEQFVQRDPKRRILRANLLPDIFYGSLEHFSCMVGNSSAGIVETAAFGIPVVNVGDRQLGRQTPLNVRTFRADAASVRAGIHHALMTERFKCANPYGDGRSAKRIAETVIRYMRQPDEQRQAHHP